MFKAICSFMDVVTLIAAGISTWLMYNTLLQLAQPTYGIGPQLGAPGLAASAATALVITVIPYCVTKVLEQARQRNREAPDSIVNIPTYDAE